jgi:hypothetical protein
MSVEVYDGITPELNRIAARLQNTQGLMRVAGGALRDALQDHFRGRGQSIYRRIASDTAISSVTPTEAVVTVGGESGPILLHKISGGWVKAKTVGKLAIPSKINTRKGVWPREYGAGQLVPLYGRNGPYALARAVDVRRIEGFRKRTLRADLKSARAGLKGTRLSRKNRKLLIAQFAQRSRAKARTAAQANLFAAVWFWLKERVYHRADAQALPPKAQVEEVIRARVNAEFAQYLG